MEIQDLREYAGKKAKEVTLIIFEEDYEKLKEISEEMCFKRADIEFGYEPVLTKEYYMGYLAAYENIARHIVEEKEMQSEIENVLKSDILLNEMFKYLNNKVTTIHEIAYFLGIKEPYVTKMVNKQEVKRINIFNVTRIGKSAIIGLTQRGKCYYKEKIENKK